MICSPRSSFIESGFSISSFEKRQIFIRKIYQNILICTMIFFCGAMRVDKPFQNLYTVPL